MKAIILASEVDSCLDPLTRELPKPMIPVINQPVIEHVLRLLVEHEVTDVTIHGGTSSIKNHFGSEDSHGATLSFDFGGAKGETDEPTIVIRGDIITNIDLSRMRAAHLEQGSLATVAVSPNQANLGVYLLQPEILESVLFGNLSGDILPKLKTADVPVNDYVSRKYWCDLDNLSQYREVHHDFFEHHVLLETNIANESNGFHIGDGVRVHPTAIVEGPAVIGAGSVIGANARITANAVIGEGVIIGEDTVIEQSIIWAGAKVGPGTHLIRCIVGYGCSVTCTAPVYDGTIIAR